MSNILTQLEQAVKDALAPMLTENGGYLAAIEVFRGDLDQWSKHCHAKGPRGFVGIQGEFNIDDQQGNLENLRVPMAVNLIDDGHRGPQRTVTDEDTGLYQMVIDVWAGLRGAVLDVGDHQTLPITTRGGSLDFEISQAVTGVSATIPLEIVIPNASFEPSIKFTTVRTVA